jgi:hypothetical protein
VKPGVALLQSWQPSSLEEAGALLRHRGQQIDDARGDVSSAFRTLSGSWHGSAADAAQGAGRARMSQLSTLAELLDLAGGVLLRAGDDLAREKSTLARLLADAASHSCTVADDGAVTPPPMPSMPAALTGQDATDWLTAASQKAGDDSSYAASLTTQIQACLTAAGEDDDAARAALASAHASANLPGAAGGATSLGGLDDYQPMDGVTAPKTLLTSFSLVDRNGDGKISDADLKAAAANESLPSDVRDAAQYMLDNPTLFTNAESINDGSGNIPDGILSVHDLQVFVAMQPQVATLMQNFKTVDVAAHGGSPDGTISKHDLEAIVASTTLPLSLRTAAQWFLDNPDALNSLAPRPTIVGRGYAVRHDGTISYNSLVQASVDDQVFTHDPAAAAAFVDSLPFPKPGDTGLPVGLVSDDGFKSLSNAALVHASGDLSETHDIISHLPETDSGLRNQLITASYVQMSQEMDKLLNGSLAGHPDLYGSSGANWMTFAPWASNGIHSTITGDFSVFGIHPDDGQRQAAADGNQWIYGDIGSRYASFLEFYHQHPNPTPAELQTYFTDNYGPGDSQIQAGMAAYSELMTTDDPVRRQDLAYQANLLVATHEQDGAQPWLERIMSGVPDKLATHYVDIKMGNQTIQVDHDVPTLDASLTSNNLVLPQQLMSLDPGHVNASSIAPTALGGGQLPTITGEESRDKSFPITLHDMADKGGWYSAPDPTPLPGDPFPVQMLVHANPDTQTASGAQSWTDRDERMYMLAKLFEQEQTNPQLFDPQGIIHVGFDSGGNAWLDPRTGLR